MTSMAVSARVECALQKLQKSGFISYDFGAALYRTNMVPIDGATKLSLQELGNYLNV